MADDVLDRVRTFAARGDDVPVADGADADVAVAGGADDMAKTDEQAPSGGAATAETAAEPERAKSNGAGGSPQGLAAAGAIRACPIPAGAVIFGELTSAFVDGARLLRFLGDRKHTGAVIDAGRTRVQVALLHEGQVVGLVSAGDGSTRRLEGLSLPGPGAQDEHELTVLTYRPEVVHALSQLVNLPERFERMHGSFVDLPALLQFLRREKANGAVRVTTGDDAGVILVRGGEVLGAYTRQKPELDDADVVFPLATRGDAEIDVHTGALSSPPPSVSVQSIVGG